MSEADKKLAERLASNQMHAKRKLLRAIERSQGSDCCAPMQSISTDLSGSYTQWSTKDNKAYFPVSSTRPSLPPAVYEISINNSGNIYLEKVPVLTRGLLRFPQTDSDRVVEEIQKFWERESIFREYKLTHKRGIILWGPPGSGKSCTVRLIMEDVVGRGGICVKFTSPDVFTNGMRAIREIQPDTPIVVFMEDLDSILEMYNESSVLNILDGVDQFEKVVFLATTNYPEMLGSRIINRPSRFDKRFLIEHPNSESRLMYLEYIIGGPDKVSELKIPLDRWVKDTEGLSLSHLQELFVAVVILGDPYKQAVETLQSMSEQINSKDGEADAGHFGLADLYR